MVAGISLANKCQLLFGAAVVAILAATLSVPWLVTGSMVHQGALAAARQLADDRLATDNMGDAVATPPTVESLFDDPQRIGVVRLRASHGSERKVDVDR